MRQQLVLNECLTYASKQASRCCTTSLTHSLARSLTHRLTWRLTYACERLEVLLGHIAHAPWTPQKLDAVIIVGQHCG